MCQSRFRYWPGLSRAAWVAICGAGVPLQPPQLDTLPPPIELVVISY